MEISIIGGDLRNIRLAQLYANENNKVYTFGIEKYFNNKEEKNIINCTNLETAISSSKYIISSIPFTKDGINVNTPFSDKEIKVQKLKELIKNKYFIAGKIPKDYYDDKTINNIDLLENEELTILNAIPTVEGTIKIAINEREETIHESNVLVCGFGKIGKILCDKFSALGANIYCTARKDSDLAWIREKRYFPLKYDELQNFLNEFDVIINTVPYIILGEKELKLINKNTLIIDLASSPGGVDKEYAQKEKMNLIVALGIPGRETPKTAAKYIKKIISKNIV